MVSKYFLVIFALSFIHSFQVEHDYQVHRHSCNKLFFFSTICVCKVLYKTRESCASSDSYASLALSKLRWTLKQKHFPETTNSLSLLSQSKYGIMIVTVNGIASLWARSLYRSDKGLTLEKPALKIFTLANLRYQFS